MQGAPVAGKRRFGVPPGGAFDPQLQQRLNARAGNPPDAPVLELALCQLSLRALEDVVMAWGGAAAVSIDGLPISTIARVQTVRAGSVVVFDAPIEGARHWVAVRGGFVYQPPALLKRGDRLYLGETLPFQIVHPPELDDMSPSGSQLRAIPARPEFRRLFKNRYIVRHDSDRVGIRLEGPRMAHDLELPSEPATPGVVQITPNGLPIILGPDGPTIGGYPRAAVVISADLSALAQLRPGAEVRFAPAGANLNK